MKIPVPLKATNLHFYKYSGADHIERLKVIILEHELYLPSLTQLNDPADGRPKLAPMSEKEMTSFFFDKFVKANAELPLAALEEQAVILEYNVRHHGPEALRSLLSPSLNEQLEGYRIYSLSKRYNNMVLWGTYAASHTGYCLEFANEGSLFECAKTVTYGDYEVGITDPELRNGYFFFCKAPAWEYEEEVRLVQPRGKGCKVKIDPRWLTRVILGKDMTQANRKLVREWANQRKTKLQVVKACYDEICQKLMLSEE